MIPYIENFYTKTEADELFAFVQSQPSVRRKTQYGAPRLHTNYPSYSIPAVGNNLPLEEMPPIYRELQARLSAYAGRPTDYVNCLGALGFHGTRESMNWHQHNAPFVRAQADQSVWVLSLGTVRPIGIRVLGDENERRWERLYPRHGSLYVLPHSYNTTHEHAVLANKNARGLRIGVNCGHYENLKKK